MMQCREIIFRDYKFSTRFLNKGSLRLRSASEVHLFQSYRSYSKSSSQPASDFKLNCLAGSVNSGEVDKFHRLLFRATKGNLWFNAQQIVPEEVILQENRGTPQENTTLRYSSRQLGEHP